MPLPPGKNTINSRWVYKIKTKLDGSVERYKLWLIVKGFAQTCRTDYEVTFAPVAKMTTVPALIVVASVHKWSISQMNIENVFLNGYLKGEVYMVPPFGVSHLPNKV